MVSDNQGQAVARGFRPNGLKGQFQIRVNATFKNQTASVAITQTNAVLAASGAATAGAGVSAKLIVVLAAIGAGAAAGGAWYATHSGTGTPTVPAHRHHHRGRRWFRRSPEVIPMRILVPFCLAICSLYGQAGKLGAPSTGFVFDQSTHALRQIQGIPGAALVGTPVDFGLAVTAAWVAPRLDSAFVLAADGQAHLFRLSANAPVGTCRRFAGRAAERRLQSVGNRRRALFPGQRASDQRSAGRPHSRRPHPSAREPQIAPSAPRDPGHQRRWRIPPVFLRRPHRIDRRGRQQSPGHGKRRRSGRRLRARQSRRRHRQQRQTDSVPGHRRSSHRTLLRRNRIAQRDGVFTRLPKTPGRQRHQSRSHHHPGQRPATAPP